VLEWITLGELITLTLLALALGMDAFSLSLGLGLSGLSLRRTMSIAVLTGFFHIIMPLFGMAGGRLIGEFVGHLAVVAGGALLIMFGLNMIYGSLFGMKASSFNLSRSRYGIMLFSISVSLDSFSVGLSLGMFAMTTWVAILLFGLFSLVLTWLGLILGRHFGHWMGRYSEAVGGLILFAFGLKFLF
jgi:putative Mn2+ efflux pump MntP